MWSRRLSHTAVRLALPIPNLIRCSETTSYPMTAGGLEAIRPGRVDQARSGPETSPR